MEKNKKAYSKNQKDQDSSIPMINVDRYDGGAPPQ